MTDFFQKISDRQQNRHDRAFFFEHDIPLKNKEIRVGTRDIPMINKTKKKIIKRGK